MSVYDEKTVFTKGDRYEIVFGVNLLIAYIVYTEGFLVAMGGIVLATIVAATYEYLKDRALEKAKQ